MMQEVEVRHILDEPERTSAATLQLGDGLEVRLEVPEGAAWSAVEVPGNLQQRAGRTTAGPRGSALQSFRFEAAGPGKGLLRLALTPSTGDALDVRDVSVWVTRT